MGRSHNRPDRILKELLVKPVIFGAPGRIRILARSGDRHRLSPWTQDQQEECIRPDPNLDLSWMDSLPNDENIGEMRTKLERMAREGTPGTPLTNPGYRFNNLDDDLNPLRNVERPGYEAEARELAALFEQSQRNAEE